MKPLRLKMTAFGPYADEQVIDFAELQDRRFFLITGPTGSGKTSILDAICFALYGESSGGERDAPRLRSDHALPDIHTEVVYDFALGNRVYRVARKPKQEVTKLRGEGTRSIGPDADLWDRSACEDETEEGTVLASRDKNVTKQIIRLLRYNEKQFRQVVMLPQEKFREVLTADADKRKDILKTLFQTGFYEDLETRLRDEKREIERELDSKKRETETTLAEKQCETLEQLRQKLRDLESEQSQLDIQRRTVADEEKKARTALEQGREANRLLREKADATEALEALVAREKSVEIDKGRLKNARAAEKVLPLEKELRARGAESTQATEKEEAARAAAASATQKLAEAKAIYTKEEARESERRTAAEKVHHLTRLHEAAAQLEAARKATQAAAAKEEQCRQKREKTELEIAETRSSIEEKTTRLGVYKEAASALAYRQSEEKRLTDLLALRMQLGKLESQESKLATTAEVMRTALDGDRKALRKAEAALQGLREIWHREHAAILAAELEDGKPCPVCGATEHPARATGHEIPPTQEDIDEAEKEVAALRKRIESASAKLSETESELSGVNAKIDTARDALGESAKKRIDDMESSLRDAKDQVSQAQNAGSQAALLEREITELKSTLKTAEERLASESAAFDAASREHAEAQGSLRQQEAAIPEELRASGALTKALKDAVAEEKGLQESLESARKSLESAREASTRAITALEEANIRKEQCIEAEASTSRAFEEMRRKIGMADESTWSAARADIPRIETLEAAINTYAQELKSARDRLAKAAKEAEGRAAAQEEKLLAACEEKGGALDSIIQRLGSLSEMIRSIKKAVDRVERLQQEFGTKDQFYATVAAPVAEAVQGRPPNTDGISLHRFILSAFLDDVLNAANRRLHTMTRGRYRLDIAGERVGRARKQGLDLVVQDDYTGHDRPVYTLSGGEGFLASLSLALGLAEVVTAYAGGIRLDAIFIDEGFGSLDEESLDLAVRSLIDLQEGGRLVGVISHIEEMRAQIDARLEVTATRHGSKAAFVVG